MTTEIAKAEQQISRAADIPVEPGRGLVVRNSGDLKAIAQVIAASGLCPQGYIDKNTKQPKLNDIKIAIAHGQEIGMSPMQALNSLSVINNRADLYAEGRPALIFGSKKIKKYRDGFKGKFPEDDFCAWVEIERSDCDVTVYREFSVWDAKQAGLWMAEDKWGKPTNWKLYPKDQLMWKAMSRALRVGFGDLLKGVGFVEDDRDTEIHGMPSSAAEEQQESRISFETDATDDAAPTDDVPYPDEDVIDAETEPVSEPEEQPEPPAGSLFGIDWFDRLEAEIKGSATQKELDRVGDKIAEAYGTKDIDESEYDKLSAMHTEKMREF